MTGPMAIPSLEAEERNVGSSQFHALLDASTKELANATASRPVTVTTNTTGDAERPVRLTLSITTAGTCACK